MRAFALLPAVAVVLASLGACTVDPGLVSDSAPVRVQGGTSWYWQNGVCIKVNTENEDDLRYRVPPGECRVE